MRMSDNVSLQRIKAVLQPLALHESDFAAGDAIVSRIAMLKTTIDELDPAAEPWLVAWLSDEHYKGAVLYAAAKTNWKHEQEGPGTLADRQMRAKIVTRFNMWVEQLVTRLREYERGSRTAAAVAAWRTGLAHFKEDPVRND